MQEIKKDVKVPKEDYIQRLTAANSSERDLAIVISFGGRGLAFNNICKLLKKNNVEPKDASMMADLMSKMGMNMEMMKDNSDSRVADMLTKGFTMGNVDISKKIDRFEGDADKEILNLAKEMLDFGQKNIEFLKPYL